VIRNFFKIIFDEANTIYQILSHEVLVKPLTASKQADFDCATVCHNCKVDFTQSNPKTRHHDHVLGVCLFDLLQM